MLFSLITVTRNNLAGLRRTRSSVEQQSCRDFEWIIIDGGSDDGTKDYLPELKANWVSEPDGGIYDAMNKGLERASGDYLLFLNAGDALAGPDVLKQIACAIREQSHPSDFIYGDALEECPGHPPALKQARNHKNPARGLFTHHQAMLYRRDKLAGLRYDLRYKIAADYGFTLRFLQRAEHILYCPFPLCLFESGGVSQQQARKGRQEQFHIRKTLRLTPLSLNIVLYAVQAAASAFKRLAPRLYWRLRAGYPP